MSRNGMFAKFKCHFPRLFEGADEFKHDAGGITVFELMNILMLMIMALILGLSVCVRRKAQNVRTGEYPLFQNRQRLHQTPRDCDVPTFDGGV